MKKITYIKAIYLLVIMIVLCDCSCGCSRSNRTDRAKKNANREVYSESRRNRSSSKKKVASTSVSISKGESEILSGSDIFTKYNPAVFMVYTSDGDNSYQGSGFFISSSGLAVSNYHVFKGTYKGLASIKTSDGKRYDVGEVIAYDNDDDIFVFKVNGSSFNYVPISNRKVRVGEKAYAIGSPRGFENTFSSGEVSQIRSDDFIQINVPIDHGSSGGVLLNEYGEAIGITTAGRDDSGANLNFAKDINVLRKYINLK